MTQSGHGGVLRVDAAASVVNYDTYDWTQATGPWGDPASWVDVTDPNKVGGVPGPTNNVYVGEDYYTRNLGTDFQVNGTGTANVLSLTGNVVLDGVFGAAAVADVDGSTVAQLMGPGHSLTTHSLNLTASTVLVGASTTLRAVTASLQNIFEVGISLDAQGTLDIGTATTSAAGVLTVDKGGSLSVGGVGGTLMASSFEFDGRFLASGSVSLLTQSGSAAVVAGTGQLDIASNSALLLGKVSPTNSVYFRNDHGDSGTLVLDASSFDTQGRFGPYVRGFATGDRGIEPGDSIVVSGVTFDDAVWSRGTLSLTEGGLTVDTILLPGRLSGDVFSVNHGTVTAEISHPGTFDWVGGTTGVWGNAENWRDEATSLSDKVPGAGDTVVLSGQTITGTGSAAFLSGYAQTDGTFAFGSAADGFAIVLGGTTTFGGSATETGATVEGGGTLSVAGDFTALDDYIGDYSISTANFVLTGAGSTFKVGGTLTSPLPTDMTITDGATLQAGSAIIESDTDIENTGYPLYNDVYGYGSFTLDSTSVLEIGDRGNAAKGAITVDAGATFGASGPMTAPLVIDNGTIHDIFTPFGDWAATTASGAPTPITGDGRIVLDSNEELPGFGVIGSGITVALAGKDKIDLTPSLPAGQSATITNFDASDTIAVAGTVTQAVWNAGTLVLYDGTTEVSSVRLPGSFAADGFIVQQEGSVAEVTTSLPAGPFYWGAASGQPASWSTAANWLTNTGATQTRQPGARDSVVLGPFGIHTYPSSGTITGTGQALVVTEDQTDNFSLSGDFQFGSLDTAGVLTVDGSAADATIGSATLRDGSLAADDKAVVTITGTTDVAAGVAGGVSYLSAAGGTLKAAVLDGGGTLQLGAENGGTISVSAIRATAGPVTIQTDSTSSIVVGSQMAGAPDEFVVGSGTTINVGDLYTSTVVDDGNMIISDSTGYLTTGYMGSGTVDLDFTKSGESLALGGSSSSLTIKFLGSNGDGLVLNATSVGQGLFGAQIEGFGGNPADSLSFLGTTITAADWAANMLSVFDGTKLVGKLNLDGDYARRQFKVTDDTVYLVPASSAVAQSQDAFRTALAHPVTGLFPHS